MNVRIVLISCLLFAVTGCQEQNDTYDYFMSHPKALKKEFANCQTIESAKCAIVMRAADDFTQLVEEQNNDPESMGQKIMQSQQQLSVLLQEYEQAKLSGDEKKIQLAREAYQDQSKKLKFLYAVVAMRSPG